MAVALVLVVLFLIWQYVGFRSDARLLPPGVTMAGLEVGGMTRGQALNALEVAFATPLEVTYVEEALSLDPTAVELSFDIERTAANLDDALTPWRGFDGFIAHVFRRSPGPLDVPVEVSYSSERLDAFLERVAAQYDQPPQGPVPLPERLTFSSGRPGYTLDLSRSRVRVSAALVSAATNQVELVVETEDAPSLDISTLSEMVSALIDAHPGLVVGVFAKSLQTGQELEINSEVAFSGLSLLKIAILEETYRALDPPLDPQVAGWLGDAFDDTADSNAAANLLLSQVVGQGDTYQGVENLTMSMGQLRLLNTFIAAPYDDEYIALAVSTPANSRRDIFVSPTPSMQTTPLDMGLLLEMIYQCSQGGGALLALYPDFFTTEECGQMLSWLSGNSTDTAVFIEAGVPAGTEVLHRPGFTGDTHADAAIISGPAGDFVLVVFVYRPDWLEWEESSALIADITAAVYNYFSSGPH